jgi:diguanylate cyclase (GGDEF)-like protein/PAS domain S-box-containing protein
MQTILKSCRPHILVLFALLTIGLSGWHDVLRNGLTDLRFRWTEHAASGQVAVIAIDAHSLDRIGVWPWPRRLHAELLRQLQRAGVRDIAFDVDFSAPSDPQADKTFGDALQSLGGSVLLPVFEQPLAAERDQSTLHVNRPLPQFEAHAWSALVNVMSSPDGRVRRYSVGDRLEGMPTPSLAAALTGEGFGEADSFLIDFGISAASIPIVSYVDVLNGDPATLDRLRDKRVIIGGTALELGDRFSVPNGRILPGPVLQALAAESILQGRALQPTSIVVTFAGVLTIVVLMMVCWRRMPAGWRALLLVATGLLIEAGALLLQSRFALVLDSSLLQIAIAAYLIAIALHEIDFRGLLRRVAENRFQRIAMSLGDGLICTDGNALITVWNPGAAAIFGYDEAEAIGKQFDLLCVANNELERTFSLDLMASLPSGAVSEFEGRRKNGELFPVEASFAAWQGADGRQYGAILRDISARKREAAQIRYLAEYDTLTGLANRNTLQSRLTEMIAAAEPTSSEVALLVIGLDRFQQINDMLGHSYGDRVLRAVAERLSAEIGNLGLVARFGNDEFAIAIAPAVVGGTITELAEHLICAFDHALDTGNRQHRVRISIGVAIYAAGGSTADELLSNAHLALSRAKTIRPGSHVMFEDTIRAELEARLNLEAELALALERHEFELFYQPQVNLLDGRLIGAEALIRWRHPTRGLVPPGAFIPVVNSSAISDGVAAFVLETACRQARQWELAGRSVQIGVNLSPSQLHSADLAAAVAASLATTGLSPGLLELEVTEDILLHDETGVLDIFRRIQALGVSIVFDDFGTGYASLSYLKKFPLDGLKIDRSFVLDLLGNADDAAIVGSTINLSRQLGLSVIAEGIENRATADLLLRLGCERGQGYFFGKPMPATEFEAKFLTAKADPVSESMQHGMA